MLMVVGDRKGRVGVGLGKAPDVVSAIKKGIKKAKKKMVTIPIDGTTIPFPVEVKEGAAVVMLKPAPKGSGVIAGGPVRAVVEAAGIRDISSKILGSQNQASNVYATFEALKRIQNLVSIKGLKLRSLAEIEAEEQKKSRNCRKNTRSGLQVSKNRKRKSGKPLLNLSPRQNQPPNLRLLLNQRLLPNPRPPRKQPRNKVRICHYYTNFPAQRQNPRNGLGAVMVPAREVTPHPVAKKARFPAVEQKFLYGLKVDNCHSLSDCRC